METALGENLAHVCDEATLARPQDFDLHSMIALFAGNDVPNGMSTEPEPPT